MSIQLNESAQEFDKNISSNKGQVYVELTRARSATQYCVRATLGRPDTRGHF